MEKTQDLSPPSTENQSTTNNPTTSQTKRKCPDPTCNPKKSSLADRREFAIENIDCQPYDPKKQR
jgi:hypothetical protein